MIMMASRRTEAFGRLVRQRRRALGLTQAELAGIAGLHPSQISHIEQGWRSVRLETIYRLAWALDVEAADLMPRFLSSPDDRTTDLSRVPPPDPRPPRPGPRHPRAAAQARRWDRNDEAPRGPAEHARGQDATPEITRPRQAVRRPPHLPPPPVMPR